MDIHQLEIFEAVIVTGSMTRAAERLSITPAAVSQQMRNLARELGVELFAKTGNRLLPTPAALKLSKSAAQLTAVVGQIRADFERGPEQDSQPLIISTGITPLIYHIGIPLRRFRRKYPHANILIQTNSTPQTLVSLQERRADIGVVVLPVEAAGIDVMHLYDEELKVAVNAKTPPVKGASISMRELARTPLILFPTAKSATRGMLNRRMEQLQLEMNVAMELDDTEAIKKLIALGLGSSILPEYAIRRAPGIKALRVEGERFHRSIALATAKSPYPRRLVLELCRYLRDAVGARTASA